MSSRDPFLQRREPIDLDRTGMRRVADATRLLIQVSGGKRATERTHRIGESVLSTLMRTSPPWRVHPDMLERLEDALASSKLPGGVKVKRGDVLAGRIPAPKAEPPPKKARPAHHVHRSASESAR